MNPRQALVLRIFGAIGLLFGATIVVFAQQHTVVVRPNAADGVLQSLYDRLQELEDDRRAALEAADQDDIRAADSDAMTVSTDPAISAGAASAAQRARSSAAANRQSAARASDEMRIVLMQIASLEGKPDVEQPRDNAPASRPGKLPKPEKPPKPDKRVPVPHSDVDFSPDPDPQVGTWVLDLSKSKLQDDSPPLSETQRIEIVKGGLRVIDETTTQSGRIIRSEWTMKYDGKDYPVKGISHRLTIAARRIDQWTFEFTTKAAGHIAVIGQIVCSPDGNSKTISTRSEGSSDRTVMVWRRQP